MSAHGILSPSGFNTWGNCPGSVVISRDIPEEPSVHAEEGTKAHELACAIGVARAKGEVDEPKSDDGEMLRCARDWAELTHGYLEGNLGYGFEYRVNLLPVTNREEVGTADFWALQPDGRLVVCDFKYGMGVRVPAERNGQLSIYAAALLAQVNGGINFDGKAKSVELVIFQPRIYSEPSTWDPSNSEFLDFVSDIMFRAEGAEAELARFAKDPKAKLDLRPGEAQCRFCRAKSVCPALRDLVKKEIDADFDVIPIKVDTGEKDPAPVPSPCVPNDPEKLARVLPWLETIEKWCAACRQAAVSRIERGEYVSGWKLVNGRKGARKWSKGAQDKIDHLRLGVKVLYEKKLISPAKAEKLARTGAIGPRQWKKMQELIERGDGSRALVPESDPRPALLFDVADDFKVISQDPAPENKQLENKSNNQADDPLDFI